MTEEEKKDIYKEGIKDLRLLLNEKKKEKGKMTDKEKAALLEGGIKHLILQFKAIAAFRTEEAKDKCFVEKSMLNNVVSCWTNAIGGMEYLIESIGIMEKESGNGAENHG